MESLLILVGSILLHTYEGGGILAGFLHPLLGIDHLLAMLAVGFISAQMGGRAVWTVPTAFVVAMTVGAILGIYGVPLAGPIVDYGITGSVVILGVGILLNRNLPEWIPLLLTAVFGFLHGHAHGTALPSAFTVASEVAAYIAGFLVATIGLHVVGALIAIIISRNKSGLTLMRVMGGIVALIGVFLVMGV